ncbi:GntR family transcriptional regulator [Rhodopseudomonas thermotolerans]|uniref:GntR family transcriptional regulator n=2 Tax=Rhodopseudomonas TaxID=1073 RepID=A0A336JNT4_9BRAD|nr:MULTISPECIES: FCD domain-containing protein [Rhodopseudomonas]RED34533.1 GntR family transcriptional regulator [Rhodopseudomonas pentothenatexigens]REG02729.1 GntR family transcriptional regulator [Rhodopseudomonas thermotolerans]SSW91202.1 GntR family transcriptional regulator [Rhodopseudomonas pentothenatexigens]
MAIPLSSETSHTVRKTLEFVQHHRLARGDRLPSERELSERFGVARSSVREALAVLDAMRITERRPKSGIYLRNAVEDGGLDALVLQADLGLTFDPQITRDVTEARIICEEQALRLACQRRTDADLSKLHQTLQAYAATIQAGGDMAEADVDFHLALVAASQNRILVRTLTPLMLMSRRWRQRYFESEAIRRRSLDDHHAFVAAVEARDEAAAAALVRCHVETAAADVRALAEQGGTTSTNST